MVDMATRQKLPKAHKCGIVVGTKTQYLMLMNGEKKLKVPYSARHAGPVTKEWRSLMSRDIGSCIRSKVPMIVPSYLGLQEEYRDIVNNNVEMWYDNPPTDVDMWTFVDKTAAVIYKDCHQHYLHVSKVTPPRVPYETRIVGLPQRAL